MSFESVKTRVGFGAYRISIRSNDHYDALVKSLEEGCDLIDTSANYTNGESELLIGKVLKDFPDYSPFIISKGGYIQGDNLKLLEGLINEGKVQEDLVRINDNLCHSIHPEFLETQIDLSLERLGLDSIDCYLLHNPEYYLKTDGASHDEMLRRIENSLVYLEEQCSRGRIKSYGISSNSFSLQKGNKEYLSFKDILDIVQKKSLKNFKAIQFPFNLIEVGALTKEGSDLSVIELANLNGIKTICNRPLNAFKDNRLVRLARYNELYEFKSLEEVLKEFDTLLGILNPAFKAEGEDIRELPMIKQIKDLIPTLISQDGVEQIFFGHFFPFVARIFGRDLTKEESQPFYDFYESVSSYSRFNQDEMAKSFEAQAISGGLLKESDKTLSVKAIDAYLERGIDYVLVGMKRVQYVDQLKEFFK